jgi:hypothetical protein
MNHIKPSINVKYIIEWFNQGIWEELKNFTLIAEAIEYLEYQKQTAPNCKFRFIRSEWQVIE